MQSRPAVTSEILGAIGAVEDWIPKYGHPVTKHVQHLEGNRFMVTLAMRGVPFEVHENVAMERMFDRDTEAYSKLGRDLGGRLGYHATFVRQRVSFDRVYRFNNASCSGSYASISGRSETKSSSRTATTCR